MGVTKIKTKKPDNNKLIKKCKKKIEFYYLFIHFKKANYYFYLDKI